jgi:dTDP-4-dehydrorhamnose 3,5-epimerase
MKIINTSIDDLLILEPTIYKDERGFFMETYRKETLSSYGIEKEFVQDNHSQSSKGVLRGLHFQRSPKSQGKLVRVTKGEVFDVAVDLRKNSTTYLKWEGVILSEENRKQLYVPEGFAHGFYVMSKTAEFIYKCTDTYAPEYEDGIMWNDPIININWPDGEKILSEKDIEYKSVSELETSF